MRWEGKLPFLPMPHCTHHRNTSEKSRQETPVFSISSMNEYCRVMGVGWPGDCVFRKLESIPTALLPIFQVHHCLWWRSGSSMCPNLSNFNGLSIWASQDQALFLHRKFSLLSEDSESSVLLWCWWPPGSLAFSSPSAHHLAIHHCQLSEVSVTGGVLPQLSLMTLHCRDKH